MTLAFVLPATTSAAAAAAAAASEVLWTSKAAPVSRSPHKPQPRFAVVAAAALPGPGCDPFPVPAAGNSRRCAGGSIAEEAIRSQLPNHVVACCAVYGQMGELCDNASCCSTEPFPASHDEAKAEAKKKVANWKWEDYYGELPGGVGYV